MKEFGFVKVAAAVPFTHVAGIKLNKEEIIMMMYQASANGASVLVFPELSLSAYTCGDLFQQSTLLQECEDALSQILLQTKDIEILAFIGVPVVNGNRLFNCAIAINKGHILGIIPKSFIPGYKEFYEPRWFSGVSSEYATEICYCEQFVPFHTNLLFQMEEMESCIVAAEICEDLWIPVPPSCRHVMAGATIICNLSASNVLVGKHAYRKELIANQSGRCVCGYVYASCGMGESTTDVVFDSVAVIAENASILKQSERFLRKSQVIYSEIDVERLRLERIKLNTFSNSEENYLTIKFQGNPKKFTLSRYVDASPFVPKDKNALNERCEEIINIQASGLAKRLEMLPDAKAVIGISGGLDSTLSLLVSIRAMQLTNKPASDIVAVTMPGFGTTGRTYNNAVNLCKMLGVTFREISIKNISNLMFQEIEHNPENHNITYENVQARARTYILMSVANQCNGMVIGTGDLSEIALGWCTYNGDHISMYNVNSSIPKTLVKFLVQWTAHNLVEEDVRKILLDIIEQPISPELLPSDGNQFTQPTEDHIGPYELHDFFLYNFVRFGFRAAKILALAEIAFQQKYSREILLRWLKVFFKRFFSQQWKRDCVPAGVKVGSIDLSPRGSWRMPTEALVHDFLKEIEFLN